MRNRTPLLLLLISALLISTTGAQDRSQQRGSPERAPDATGPSGQTQAIRPRPGPAPGPDVYRPHQLSPQIWTERQTYEVGDRMRLYFRVNEDAYVYIFNTDAAGRRTQIFPNYFDRSNFVRAGYTYKIPDGSYDLRIEPPTGTETLTILAVAEEYPILRRHYYGFSESQPFVQDFTPPTQLFGVPGDEGVVRQGTQEQRLQTTPKGQQPPAPQDLGQPQAVVPRPRPQPGPPPPSPEYRWGIDTITIRTYDPYGRPQPRPGPELGWLRIHTRPQGAYVYVNGSYSGRTPTNLELPEGYHDVELRKSGYATEHRRVYIGAFESSTLSIRLEPQYRHQYDINFGYHGEDWGFNIRGSGRDD